MSKRYLCVGVALLLFGAILSLPANVVRLQNQGDLRVGPGDDMVNDGITSPSTASGTITARKAFAPCRLYVCS